MSNTVQTLGARLRSLLTQAPHMNPDDLANPDPSVRWRAVHALAAQPQPELITLLLLRLADPDPTIRFEAVRTLASWNPEPADLQPAIDLLASDPSAETTTSILDLLSTTPIPAAHPLVQERITHHDPQVRSAAAHALGSYNQPGDTERLALLTDDPIPDVRRAACLALAEITDPTVPYILRQHLRDPDPLTRQIVQQAIENHQQKSSIIQD